MIHAYDEIYLSEVADNLAVVVDYLAYNCKLSNKQIEDILKLSHHLKYLTYGHPRYASGMTGVEVAMLVASDFIDISGAGDYYDTLEKSPEYWVGWALAHYTWYSCKTLSDVFYAVSFEKVLSMYKLYHEMDVYGFILKLNEMVKEGSKQTNLRIMRELNNLSQSELAKKSGVSLRSIQLYEQKVNDIDKAQVQTLFKLAKTLNCSVEKLLENPQNDF